MASNALRTADLPSQEKSAPILTAVPPLPERMTPGERRCAGESEAMRKAKTTIFTRRGQAGDTIADVATDFDALFGAGSWDATHARGTIVSVRGEAMDDLEYLYAIEFPNQAVDAHCCIEDPQDGE